MEESEFIVSLIDRQRYMTLREIVFRVCVWRMGRGLDWDCETKRGTKEIVSGLVQEGKLGRRRVFVDGWHINLFCPKDGLNPALP